MRALLATPLLCLFACAPAQAGFQHPWDPPGYSSPRAVRHARVKQPRLIRQRSTSRRTASRHMAGRMAARPAETVRPRPFILRDASAGIADAAGKLIGVATAALPTPLQDALRRVAAACAGFRVTSACRPGAIVAGTNRTSLHASCRAADFHVANYACAYAVLRGFPGGVSMDAHRVAHIHVSYAPGSGEWGARFNHGAAQYARRGKHRYARRNGRRT
jgi:hypothetical protein